MASFTVPPVPTSPQQDAIELYGAFKGFGCDSAAIVNILSHRDAAQRGLIQQKYHKIYTDDLMRHLSSELSGDLKKTVLLWMHDPAGRDATILRHTLTGDTIDLDVATKVICSRTSSQIHFLKYAYHAKFGTYLEHDIGHLASGDHKKLLLAYLSTGRYEGPEVDLATSEMDAKALYNAGEKKLGTDEKPFIEIFSGRSRAHLASVDSSYQHLYKKKLKKVVKSETSGKFEDALLTILKCAENPARYFAKGLYKAMKGLGTNDTKLIRIAVTRVEIDMQYIKAEYQSKDKKPLSDAIHSETSGQYRAFLLDLIGGKH